MARTIPRGPARPPATAGAEAARSPAVRDALARSLFVIPSIEGAALLRRMLPTLRLPPGTVVVLDQGSRDDTEAVCRAAGVRLVQLGRPHSYTEAGNIGARMARDEGRDVLFLSNNDIAFTTDVGAELVAELLDDPFLGIAAPSQVIVDEKRGERVLATRAEWHLDTMLFTHDVGALPGDAGRIEADLCELTCAAMRVSAIDAVGFLDDAYGFYYEDADFCFRLRRAGYSCAYLPGSQIEHYTSSTFSAGLSERKRAYMARNMDLFARKHLGHGVGRLAAGSDGVAAPVEGAARHLPDYLRRYGLIGAGRPSLVVGAPGARPYDYLLVEDAPGAGAAGRLASYRGLLAASEPTRRALTAAGFEDVGLAPLGFEPDLFHPWVAAARPFADLTFLWRGRGGEGSALSTVLGAWAVFRAETPGAHLLVVGAGVLGAFRHAPARQREHDGALIAEYPDDGVTLRELVEPLADEGWARLFRGVDAVISTGPAPGPPLAAAMACGALALVLASGPEADLAAAGALAVEVEPPSGPRRPSAASLVARLHDAAALGEAGRHAQARLALPVVRGRHTWRSTCAGIGESLEAWQPRQDARSALRRRREAEAAAEIEDALLAREDGHDAEPSPVVLPTALPQIEATPPPARVSAGRGVMLRLRGAGRAAAALRRERGGRAAAVLLRRALLRRTRLRLRWLLILAGLRTGG